MAERLNVSKIESLVKLYNEYNKTNFQAYHLLCHHCQKWLSEIAGCSRNYTSQTRICNLCDSPKLQQAISTTYVKDELLRDVLNEKFPCKYHASGCNVFESYENIFEHENTCMGASSCKCFCKATLDKSVLPHLRKKHAVKTTQLEKPMVTLNLEVVTTGSNTSIYLPFHLSVGFVSLIVIVSYDASSSQFNVIVSNITEIHRRMSYKATLIYDGIEHSKYGTVYDQFVSKSKKNPIYIPSVQDTVTLNIYFENYDAIQPLLEYFDTVIKDYECPICMEIIIDFCYQCTNGHNVCGKCKSMMQTCPTCRNTFNENIISIKRLTPNFLKPCKNAVNGCFIYGKAGELEDHERDCPMRKIICEMCTTGFEINDYIVHMTKQHGMKKLDRTPTTIKPGFVFYKEYVFELIVKSRVIEKETNIVLFKWCLRLMNCSKTFCDGEFEMRIEYCETITTTKGRVSNIMNPNIFCVNNAGIPIFTLTFHF